jgi:hypothetical protein
MRKSNVYIISNKKMKKEYNKFFVFLCDESMFEYIISEWEIRMLEEWVEVERYDKTEMDAFAIQNIARVRFVNTDKKKTLEMAEVVPIKPVPPTAA